MDIAKFYIVIGIVLIALEIVVPGFVLAPLGVAALVTAGVSVLDPHPVVQAITFALTAGVLFVLLRKWNATRMAKPREEGSFGVVGQSGLLLEPPESPSRPGRVKVFADEFDLLWEDSPEFDVIKELEPGARVRVVRVVGNRVVIQRIQGG